MNLRVEVLKDFGLKIRRSKTKISRGSRRMETDSMDNRNGLAGNLIDDAQYEPGWLKTESRNSYRDLAILIEMDMSEPTMKINVKVRIEGWNERLVSTLV
jgi:hypothetical protein